MSKARELYEALKFLSRQEASTFPAIVVGISGDTVDVDVAGVVYFDVQLRSITESTGGILIIPEMGSTVLVQRSGDNLSSDYFVCMYSKIKEVNFIAGSTLYKQDADGFIFQRNEETLKKILIDLVAAIRTIYAPMDQSTLTTIENRITQLLK